MTERSPARPGATETDAGPRVVTFGCRLNIYESEAMRQMAAAAGLGRDTVLINSCAVTAEAERQLRQTIRKIRRAEPDARIVVTGCAAQLNPQRYADLPEVDRVLGNAEKMNPETLAGGAPMRVNDIMQVKEAATHLLEGFDGKNRAFVEVQQGCDHRCTFCIIPFARGPNRPVDPAQAVTQIRKLVENGYREVALTGVDLTSYAGGGPGAPALAALIREILTAVPELDRLRLSSLDPACVLGDLSDLIIREPRIMPHVHLSVQSGDDLILKRMKRRHSRDDVIRIVETIGAARPEVMFGADIIAGFPTETEAMFWNTVDLTERCRFGHLHVFPYSSRPDTPAARMPQVDKAVAKRRAALLREAGRSILWSHMRRVLGSDLTLLLEDGAHGRSSQYFPVTLTEPREAGTVIAARALRADADGILAEPL